MGIVSKELYLSLKIDDSMDSARQSGTNNMFNHQLGEFDDLLYQYTKVDYLWKTLEDETLSPGHVRFSNDFREFSFGLDVIGFPKKERESAILKEESFFLCLIGKADARGMWSEYCRDGTGVCVGYDFKRPNYRWPDFLSHKLATHPKSVLGKFKDNAYSFLFEIKHAKHADSKESLMWPLAVRQVIYARDPKPHGKITSEEKTYGKRLNDVRADLPSNFSLSIAVPFIKHWTFAEENEFRFLFRMMEDAGHRLKYKAGDGTKDIRNVDAVDVKDYFHYPNEINMGKNPRLKVKCRLAEEGVFRTGAEKSNCCRYLALDARKKANSNMIEEHLIARGYHKDPITGSFVWDDKKDFISAFTVELDSLLANPYNGPKPRYIILGQGNDQKDIATALDKYLLKNTKREEFKIWCNGHPPIRKIIVERVPDTDAFVESIKRYCSHIWWAKDIDVEPSKIPYRQRPKESAKTK
jgi:hypothetical protein